MSLAAVNQFYVDHEAIKRLQKSKDSLKACFENVNIEFLISMQHYELLLEISGNVQGLH